MANVNVPKDGANDSKQNSQMSRNSSNRSAQKNYQQQLAYEQAFLKKKQKLLENSNLSNLKSELQAIQKQADADIQAAKTIYVRKADLEARLEEIRLQYVSDLAKKQMEILSEQSRAEYDTHTAVAKMRMNAMRTQSVHQRQQTLEVLADQQKIQADKLRKIKEAEIRELTAQEKLVTSDAERIVLNDKLRKLRGEITSADRLTTRYQQQAAEYAKKASEIDYNRLTVAEKLKVKQQELTQIQSKSNASVGEIESKIEAKQQDLDQATTKKDESRLKRDIAKLQAELASTKQMYESSISDLTTTISELEEKSKNESGARVFSSTPRINTTEETAESNSEQVNSADLKSQLALLLSQCEKFVSFFESYVDALESRLTGDDQVEAVKPVTYTNTPGEQGTNSVDVVDQVRSLLEQSTLNNVELQTQLNEKLDALISILESSFASSNSDKDSQLTRDNNIQVINYLRSLVSSSASDDVDLQSRLNDRLDNLSLMISSSDSSLDIGSEDLNQSRTFLPKEDLREVLSAFLDNIASKISSGEDERDSEKEDKKSKEKQLNRDDKIAMARDKLVADYIKSKEEREIDKEAKKAYYKTDEGKEQLKNEFIEKNLKQLEKQLGSILSDLSKTIDRNVNEYFSYQAELNARLQGTSLTYSKMLDTLGHNLGTSMIVSQKAYISKFKELVDSGITYNMETRAFLATVSDKVINTFEAFDSNLLRLIRLQQADTTAARMGMESSINKLLNSVFSDSSYLSSSGPHDSVSGAILEASSMLSRDMSVEFEYIIHKWLGSLYSLGMSSSTLEKIAQGINYLGTGNVSALNNDSSLQTLLSLSAVKGGVSYSDILTNGLNAEKTNKLLSGMITYLMEIANNTDSTQVTKSAYSDLLGLQMSDLRAIINLTSSDVEQLNSLTMSYSDTVDETQTQLNSIVKRTHLSTLVDTAFENAVLKSSMNIGNNPALYAIWKAMNLIEGLTGGIAIPYVSVLGSGVDLETTVTALVKSGMAGLSMLGTLVGSLFGGGLFGGLDLDSDWGNKEFTSRGSAGKFLTNGTDSGFSTSSRIDYVGSGNSEDIKKTEMSDATESAQNDAEITNKYSQEDQDILNKVLDVETVIRDSVWSDSNSLLLQSVETHNLLADKLSYINALPDIVDLIGTSRVFLTRYTSSTDSTTSGTSGQSISSSSSSRTNNYSNVSSYSRITEMLLGIVSNSAVTSSNIDIWSLINSSGSTVASELQDELKTHYLTDNYGFSDFTGEGSKQADGNTKLIEELSLALNNSTRSTQLREDLKKLAEIQTLNKVIFPDYVRATVDELSPAVRKFIEELVKKAVESAVNGTDMSTSEFDSSDGYENYHPIIRQLRSLLADATTVVNTRESFV